jgi:hypothetical protein
MATTFAVPDGRVAMNAVLRNGFGASGGSITSLNFQPDLVWEKSRNGAFNHQLIDSVRGVSKSLHSNLTSVEDTYPTYFLSFNTNGYTLGAGDYTTGDTLVDWCWKAGGTAVSNTAGTITSSVSANTTAGFSVVTYTGNGVNSTMGHGLGVAPAMIFYKSRTTAEGWPVYHSALAVTNSLALNNNNLQQPGGSYYWNDTAPTSTLIRAGTDTANNGNGTNYVAYCWAPVAGYSAFGSYTGNGSADGPFIYTGFRPRWLMLKNTGGAASWYVLDSSRNTYNVEDAVLIPNTSQAEVAITSVDFLSNGFKLRTTTTDINGSGTTYIYAAFAESAFKFSNAR